MGILFYCPNGHKLNVKVFLAGKRGICPHCDARFQIPDESQIPGNAPKIRPESAERSAAPVAAAVGVATEPQVGFEASLGVRTSAPSADPIAEAPEAVWYVRPPAGGQFGPARGDVLRQWITEGRVSADSMVWREGWLDWKAAGPIFPELGSAPPVSSPVDQALDPPQDLPAVGTSATESAGRRARSRNRGSRKSLAAVVCLALLIVVLLVVLVQVSTR